MNKQQLISTLKALDTLDSDQKAYLIDLVNTKKKYGLVWEDKPEDVEELLRQHLPVLTEVPERRIMAVAGGKEEGEKQEGMRENKPVRADQAVLDFAPLDNPFNSSTLLQGTTIERVEGTPPLPFSFKERGPGDEVAAPDHILIEGDNLHALTALTFTHEGRVDVIYIDPPYNTGNKDFKYNDRFVDREDSYRHSKWLSFMHKRLLIAKRLLAETGVIFISIDDNEQAQLKLLCDEVFGEENFVANVVWQSKKGGGSDNNYLVTEHEYVYTYARMIDRCQISKTEIEAEPLDKLDKIGAYRLGRELNKWGANSLRKDRPTMFFPIKGPMGVDVYPIRNDEKEGCWRWGAPKMHKAVSEDNVEFVMRSNGTYIAYEKIRHIEPRSKPHRTFLNDIGTTADGSKMVRDIFDGEKKFQFPKPLSLLGLILKIASSGAAPLILDFFAGSGTTLHATMQLNAEDGGNRQCILVTNNENNIAEEVCYERNRRVIQGYKNAKGQEVPGLTNNSLRYYRCETVPRQTTLPAKRLLMQRATELLCIKEGLYEEVPSLARPALSLGNQIRGYGGKQGTYLLVIYDDLCIEEAVALISQTVAAEPDARFRVYVFSNGQYPYTEEFEEVLPYVTLCALPDALYKAYRQVLPDQQAPARLDEAEESEVPDLFTETKK